MGSIIVAIETICLVMLDPVSPNSSCALMQRHTFLVGSLCHNFSQFYRYHCLGLLVLQYLHDYFQCQIGPCYAVCARGMQSLKHRVRHLLQFEFGGTGPSPEPERI